MEPVTKPASEQAQSAKNGGQKRPLFWKETNVASAWERPAFFDALEGQLPESEVA